MMPMCAALSFRGFGKACMTEPEHEPAFRRFNESSSTLSSILSSLVSQGKVQNEGGTYRFVSAGGRGSVSASRSPSPAPSYSRSASPVSRSAVSNGSGGGAVAGDEAVVLSVLQNYAGLTEQRLSAMIRSTGK